MAITAAKKTTDFSGFIKPEMAKPIFDQAIRQSAIMQLAQQVPLGASGVEIPVVTTKPTANWTAEAGKKHTTQMDLGLVKMQPKKLTAIGVTSTEVIRANPAATRRSFVSFFPRLSPARLTTRPRSTSAATGRAPAPSTTTSRRRRRRSRSAQIFTRIAFPRSDFSSTTRRRRGVSLSTTRWKSTSSTQRTRKAARCSRIRSMTRP